MIDERLQQMQQYFKENNYLVIKGFLDKSTADLFYTYAMNKVRKIDFKMLYDKEKYDPDWDGTFGDPQAPISYSCYGDDLIDTVLVASAETISNYTGLNLAPNYSYWRFYQQGEILKRHRDRDSCEISATLCLGYNISNLKTEENPEPQNWPMWVETKDDPENGAPVYLEPGDIIIYRGCEVDHWRDRFTGLNHAQAFIHYNDTSGPYQKTLDGRPMVCIPKKFQTR